MGFEAAWARWTTGIQPSCSRVVPYSWKWRWAAMAIQLAADTALNGMVHCWAPSTRPPAPRPPIVTASRPWLPWAEDSVTLRKHSTWRHRPALTARAALTTDPS